MPIHASLGFRAAAADVAASTADIEKHAALTALAARHGVELNPSPENMRWLSKAELPADLGEPAYAVVSTLVRHLFSLSTPGASDRSDG